MPIVIENGSSTRDFEDDGVEVEGDEAEVEGDEVEVEGDEAEVERDGAEIEGDGAEIEDDGAEIEDDGAEIEDDGTEIEGDKLREKGDESNLHQLNELCSTLFGSHYLCHSGHSGSHYFRHSGCALGRNPLVSHFSTLLTRIKKNNSWQQMFLGPLDQESIFVHQIQKKCRLVKIYARADNWYCDNIQSFHDYYSQRPSQLKNTIRRKEKKLTKAHDHHVEIISEAKGFEHYFSDYQRIYQLSWKGEETSFEFIKQVCLQAAAENKLRMGLLFIDGVAVAAQIWFVQQGTASIFKLAYDPQYQKYSVGSILSMALSQYVIDIDKVHTIEFGMGSEPYKKDWMDKCKKRVTLQVFNHKTMIGNLLAFRYIVLSKIKGWILAEKC